MAYATVQEVHAWAPALFNRNDAPSDPDVRMWLADGAAMIDIALKGRGYNVPVASTADAYNVLRNLNAKYAAAQAWHSRMVSAAAPGATTQGDKLEALFKNGLKALLDGDLSGMGLSPTSDRFYVGGISESEKESVEDDTDRIMTVFRRGMHAHRGAGTTGARVPTDPQERSD
jgi:hypothetical protein